MKEYIIHGKPNFGGSLREVEVPKPGPSDVLIKVRAAGLNPKDWKFTKGRTSSEALNAGDDVAGIVEAVGSEVFEYKPGDRVAAFHRMGHPAGTYAEYTVAPASTTFRLPPNISFEAGAGIPLSFITAALALYQYLQVPLPTTLGSKDIPILIYGGASAVGSYALQLARLSNLNPIITVAGSGIAHVEALNAATHIIDYRKGDVAKQILEAARGAKLTLAFDAISGHGSYKHITEVLQASGGGHINMVDLPTDPDWSFPADVRFTRTFVSSAYRVKHNSITDEQAKADADFSYFFYRYLSLLLAEGSFKPHPIEVLPNGLNHIVDGVKLLHDGKVSAKKLIAR
ncbi:related to zeta-crystallin / quinone reductase (NADPH) [Fusarium oxysporum]|uniref:Related to zeta-crystallin / quinone reductase (NADPH) n=1 Tax=Fusarium oxysporum TaxID=5507 RepID=A0A2H3T1W6_FUSOX|nr:related to zeta-crystallin / quinone reductase (NADPH) [Fusarium oxysporum]